MLESRSICGRGRKARSYSKSCFTAGTLSRSPHRGLNTPAFTVGRLPLASVHLDPVQTCTLPAVSSCQYQRGHASTEGMDRRYIEAKRNLITGKLRKELSDFRSVKQNDRNLPYISGSSISFGLTNDGIAPRGITKPFRRTVLCKQPIIPRAPCQLFTSDSTVAPHRHIFTPYLHKNECTTLSSSSFHLTAASNAMGHLITISGVANVLNDPPTSRWAILH